MNALNQTLAQIRELFASMTPGARITAGLLLAVVVVSLGFLFQQATTGPDEYLFGGDPIGRTRLPRMEAAMSTLDIPYTTEGTRIKVAKADKHRAVAAIAAAGELPADFHHLMQDALEGGGMFDFKDIKLQRLRAGREAQVSLVLSKFPFVDSAEVIHQPGQRRGLTGMKQATVAVSVMPAVGESLNTRRSQTIKDFVAKACGVDIANVALTNLGSDIGSGDGDISPEDFDHPLYKLKAMEERRIREQILSQLNNIAGVKVQVNATIDEKREHRVVETKPAGEPVQLAKSGLDETDKKSSGGQGDRVGLEAQGPATAGREEAIASNDQSEKTVSSSEVAYGTGVQTTTTVNAGLALKAAEASIVVPMSFVRTTFEQENLDADGNPPDQIDANQLLQTRDEIQKRVENIVQPLLPKLALGEDEFKQVKVEFMTDMPISPLPEPSMAAGALAWTNQYGNTLIMAGLAMFSLVMLRSMVNSTGKDSPGSSLASLQFEGETTDNANASPDEEEGENQRPKLKLRKADTLKDDLADMVGSDPDAAAAILRSWINNNAA